MKMSLDFTNAPLKVPGHLVQSETGVLNAVLGNQIPCPKGQKSSVCVVLISGMNRWDGDRAAWKCWLISNGCTEVMFLLEILSLCKLGLAPGHS